MITIINYGLGNIRAFVNVYKRLGINVNVASHPYELKNSSKIILPGVGAFDYAMNLLNNSGMRGELERQVLEKEIPVLGICVGMQMLAKSSEEGCLPGLGWINGTVKRFRSDFLKIHKLPHMGWNIITPLIENPLLEGFDSTSRFYFLHSYYLVCTNETDIIAKSEYGEQFVSGVCNSNIYGIQFHPEKSHSNGIRLLDNFAKL
jgi:glutamine amidotransferase